MQAALCSVRTKRSRFFKTFRALLAIPSTRYKPRARQAHCYLPFYRCPQHIVTPLDMEVSLHLLAESWRALATSQNDSEPTQNAERNEIMTLKSEASKISTQPPHVPCNPRAPQVPCNPRAPNQCRIECVRNNDGDAPLNTT